MRRLSRRETATPPLAIEQPKVSFNVAPGPTREEQPDRQRGTTSKQFGWVAKSIKTPQRPIHSNWFVPPPTSEAAKREKQLNALHQQWAGRNQVVNTILACRGHDKIAELMAPPGVVGPELNENSTLEDISQHIQRNGHLLSIQAASTPKPPLNLASKDHRFRNYLQRTKFVKPGEEVSHPPELTLEKDPSRGLGLTGHGADDPANGIEHQINDAVGRMAKCHFDLALLCSPSNSWQSRFEAAQIENAVNQLLKSTGYDVTLDTVTGPLLAQLFVRFKDLTSALAKQKTPQGRASCIAEIRDVIDKASKKLEAIGSAMANADVHPAANALLNEYGQAILDMKDALENGPWKQLSSLADEFERGDQGLGSAQTAPPQPTVASTRHSTVLRGTQARKLIDQSPYAKQLAVRAPLRGIRTVARSR
jgi:hypothetical protein